ncbi:MAG: N-6 DNA methylase [Chloroflexi bacterium]|nr:N-6 DNA methylase [Chloroflexota bacterium]
MPPLPSDLRNALERAVVNARQVAEEAAAAAVTRLAVDRAAAPATASEADRQLRNALRAHARQLGDGVMSHGLLPLVEEIAYVQWHRMLFARFLAENNLLMHPSGVAVTLEECAELAPDEGEPDAWQVAARYASAMLPGIFRPDDPTAQLRFAPEGRDKLERILAELPPAGFTSDDGLGWVYQFWQTKKKQEVNASGRKIGGADLAPVTQLFTEDYMVRFLLENSLGAWWAARHPDSPILRDLEYLRFRDDGTPAAGTFPGWPERAAEATVMDPCCGSGHFLVAAFDLLRRMRVAEEGLAESAAAEAVLRDNLYGLEIDPRCTQIAAFALALAAWKVGGYRELPLPNVACSGIPVGGQLDEWTKLAGDDERLRNALERLHQLFKNAQDLGSLIDPVNVPARERMFTAEYAEVAPLVERALTREHASDDPAAAIFGTAMIGVVRAAALLANRYILVLTNVPYLARGKQDGMLQSFSEVYHGDAKNDLSTIFVERCISFTSPRGTSAIVTPQNWLFLGAYKRLRMRLLQEAQWNSVVRLGFAAFQDMNWWATNTALLILSNEFPHKDDIVTGLDASTTRLPTEKPNLLRTAVLECAHQLDQLKNPDSRIVLGPISHISLLERYADSVKGLTTGDEPRLIRRFWELDSKKAGWEYFQSTVRENILYGGQESMFYWCGGAGPMQSLPGARTYAQGAWGKNGVLISQMGSLHATLYAGDAHDNNTAVIVPKNVADLPAIWSFCCSPEFNAAVRRIDQALKVTNASLVKVPFDLKYWRKVADEAGPLPEPYSNDPTQWLFKGHPVGSTEPLQVAVTRLLGYRWPEQETDGLETHADRDGIVCLPPVAGERPAAEQLRALLAAAFGDEWSPAQQDRLLDAVGFAAMGLDEWLRDGFFAQHCRVFHNRPFVWHVWDGRRDGFSALVNYHQLDGRRLDKLVYTYLGAWIQVQRAERDAGTAGADGRLVAALELQRKLVAIREGEPPLDVYVRWKLPHQQPVGWEPDLNDGVRLNIRPFVTAGVLRSKFTIHWKKDRGTDPGGSERINDLHRTRQEKLAARAALTTT